MGKPRQYRLACDFTFGVKQKIFQTRRQKRGSRVEEFWNVDLLFSDGRPSADFSK